MQTNKRLISLDAFRGFTIAGMIVVNTPGSWSHVYGPLLHADWHGITPTDYIFPFFLFIVGVSIALSYTKQMNAGADRGMMIRKLLKRGAIIFLLGMFLWVKGMLDYSDNSVVAILQRFLVLGLVISFLFYSDKWKIQLGIGLSMLILAFWWFPEGGLERMRIPGVLQRIAVVFVACASIFIYTSWKTQVRLAIGLLLGYWLAMVLIPIPIDEVIQLALDSGQVKTSSGMIDIGAIEKVSDGFIAANLEPGTNLQAWVDRQVIPWRMWQYTWDPEGLLSTIPAIGTGILGMLIGRVILADDDIYKKITYIFFFGILMYTTGGIWKWFFPFNKNLWSSSFVMHTAGLASMTLAAFILLIDVMGKTKWTTVGRVFGMNSIAAYVLSGMLTFIFYAGMNTAFIDAMTGIGMAPKLASFIYALFYVGIIFIPAYVLYKKRIYIKV
jgi:predicted acyltransferase